MTFAAPLFLLAALAAAIPIALHMINRQKAKELPFSTLRFLKISVQKTRRRKRIHDVLLMLMRAALLLLIALGLAKPAVTSLGTLWGGSHSAVVIVLDNSGSMGLMDQDRVRFDTATTAAMEILDQFTEGDQVALLVACGPPFPDAAKLERTQDTARQVLAQCRVSYERANLELKVRQAQALLGKSDAPNKQIYVLTDMQRVSWDGAEEEVASPEPPAPSPESRASNPQSLIPIILVDCNRMPKPNVAVQGLDLDCMAPIAGLPVKATVTLLNASSVPRQPRVELLINGTKQSGSPELDVPPEGRVKHEFQFTFRTAGLHRGEVRLVGEDGSTFDDRRYFALNVAPNIPVAIVRTELHEIPYLDDAYYLEQALSSGPVDGWAIRTTPLVVDDLIAEPLDKYKVIFCVNLPALNPDAAERLRTYVLRGGSVVWFCGDNVDPMAYNQMNQQAQGQLLPAPLVDVRQPDAQEGRDSWHVSFLDKNYPAFSDLLDPPSLYESILVYKYTRMALDKAEGMVRVLARLDDGEPLLIMRNIAQGRSLMFAVPARVEWSNLPLRPIYLPLMARLTFALAEVEQSHSNLIAGQPLVLQLPDQSLPVGVEVLPPSGETLRLKTEGLEGRSGQTFHYADTYQIGVYLLRLLSTVRSTTMPYAVNFDPDEAEPAKIDRTEIAMLQKLLDDAPLLFADNPDDLSATFALLREGKSLWGLFLSLVLIVLVFESFLSNRLSPKSEDQTTGQPPPGMRRLAKKGANWSPLPLGEG